MQSQRALDGMADQGRRKARIQRDGSVEGVENLSLRHGRTGAEADMVARLAELIPHLGVVRIATHSLIERHDWRVAVAEHKGCL